MLLEFCQKREEVGRVVGIDSVATETLIVRIFPTNEKQYVGEVLARTSKQTRTQNRDRQGHTTRRRT